MLIKNVEFYNQILGEGFTAEVEILGSGFTTEIWWEAEQSTKLTVIKSRNKLIELYMDKDGPEPEDIIKAKRTIKETKEGNLRYSSAKASWCDWREGGWWYKIRNSDNCDGSTCTKCGLYYSYINQDNYICYNCR